VIKAAGGRITEMEQSGYASFCCGEAGQDLAEEKLGTRSTQRGKHGAGNAGPFLVSNCPFCLTMIEDGIKTNNCENS